MPLLFRAANSVCQPLSGASNIVRSLRSGLDPASCDGGREPFLHAARLTALAITASRMTPATMSGCDSIKKCDAPSTSVTVESARSYWKRWRSGATGRSAVPNTAQDGFARQAAAVAGSSNAVAETERCEIARNAASASGRSAQKTSWNRAGSIDASTLPSGNDVGRTNGPMASDGKRAYRSLTDSPSSGATPATYTSPATLTELPATVITVLPYVRATSTIGRACFPISGAGL